MGGEAFDVTRAGMSGIAGLVDPAAPVGALLRIVPLMIGTLVHRGPDDEGIYVADGVGLGMRRLSIIDVARGRHPVSNEDGSVQVVFDGEIYNYLELRNGLRQRGHVFRTESDTEVIAHLYEEKGMETFAALRGMFAIALWDRRARRLVLARDRIGKKPLFYAYRGNALLFGSEIKAILAADPALAEPDVDSLAPYLRYGVVPEPRTMFRHIRKLPAAHRLVHEVIKTTIAPYWRLEFVDDDASTPPRKQVVAELDRLLEEAVRIRLMSEVPLGIFLSGGLDSSTIVAYAHQAGLRPLKTFTIGFDCRKWDESADAEGVARHFRTDHHVLTLREQDLAAGLPDTVRTLVRHFDEPFGDSAALPTYYASKLARQHATVMLSGAGGDELFAGYTAAKGLRVADQYQQLPQWLGRRHFREIVEHGARWLRPWRRSGAVRIARGLHDSELPFESRYLLKRSLCPPDLFRRILTDDAAMRLTRPGLPVFADDIARAMRSNMSEVNKTSYFGLRFGLVDDLLGRVDRMSMAHSLEVRTPLLDHRLVEFVMRLPPSMRVRGWETYAVLKGTARGNVPPATTRERKHGLSIPLREWLSSGLHEMVGDYLETDDERLPSELFNRAVIRSLLAEHRLGQADHSSIIWLLLNYAAWRDLYGHAAAFRRDHLRAN